MAPVKLSRLRKNEVIRDWVSETQLHPKDLIMPYFAAEGRDAKAPVKSMPGIYHFTVDNLVKDIKESVSLGIKAILLFGVCGKKDEKGTEAYSNGGIVQKAVRAIRKDIEDIVIITDVCLCAYTSHGHCGILNRRSSNTKYEIVRSEAEPPRRGRNTNDAPIDNPATLKALAKIAVSHAEAGADFVAPSAMMDGQVRSIREALDKNGFEDTLILAYSAKYASGFYGPFRDAMGSMPRFGDRKSYQMDFRNSNEALRAIAHDIEEGADIVMIKPALAYLDIIHRAKEKFNAPIAAYNVSGEYALVKNQKNEKDITLEILTGIKRAGADFIITYHAKEAAKWLTS
jgi:porphobilinogen synthase